MKKHKVYIAGTITGRPLEEAQAQFEASEKFLKDSLPGWQVINPMKLPHQHDKSWESYMQECIAELKGCDAMYVQRGWSESRGVMREINCAYANRIHVVWEADNGVDLLIKKK